MQNKTIQAMLAVALAGGTTLAAGCGGSGPGDSVLPGVQAMVFVQRAYERDDLTHDISGGSRQVIDYQRYTPGGGVFMLSPPTPDGTLTRLTAAFEGVDIAGLDLSFDANEVVFSMRHAEDDHYHVYTASLDGSAEVHQITFGDWDDIRPIYVPGRQIAFVTNQPYTIMGTRADEYEHSREVTQIAVVSLDGGEPLVCAQNLSHTADPFLLSDGQIGYSRWEHLGPVNDVKLFRMNPDCTGMEAIAGQFNKDFNSIVQASEIEPGVFVAIGTSRSRTIQSGAVMRIDARSQTGTDGLRIDVQQAQFENLTPAVPTGSESPPTGVGRYRNPHPIFQREDGRDLFTGQYLVAWSDGDVNDRNELAVTAPQFGIYMFDPVTERRTLVFDDPELWDLYAIPVAPRTEPRAIPHSGAGTPDETATRPTVIGNIDIAETSLGFETVSGGNFNDTPLHDALLQATHVRIIEGFSSEIGAVGQFGLTMHEGAAILGETAVQSDGSWRAAIPAYTPVHLQPLDRFGLAIRNQMLWIQGMPGESRTCGGCHSSRSGEVSPRDGTPTTIAQQLFPNGDLSSFIPIPDRVELPWAGAPSHTTVQDLFDARCVSCHDGGAADPYADDFYHVEVTTMEGEMLGYDIPYLNLSSAPLEVYYENEVVTYPSSYISLLYPSAMMDATVTGVMAPIWVEPGSARHSRLIEVVNAVAEDDPSALAWAANGLHPEDVGVTLTPEERRVLIQMADLGGQYYSRFNVDGAADWAGVEY